MKFYVVRIAPVSQKHVMTNNEYRAIADNIKEDFEKLRDKFKYMAKFAETFRNSRIKVGKRSFILNTELVKIADGKSITVVSSLSTIDKNTVKTMLNMVSATQTSDRGYLETVILVPYHITFKEV